MQLKPYQQSFRGVPDNHKGWSVTNFYGSFEELETVILFTSFYQSYPFRKVKIGLIQNKIVHPTDAPLQTQVQ